MVIRKNGILFDSGNAGMELFLWLIVAITLHQGLDRYTKRAKGKSDEDYNWNDRLMEREFANMNVASGVIRIIIKYKWDCRENFIGVSIR